MLKSKIISGVLAASTVMSMGAATAVTAFADSPAPTSANSEVSANIQSGGLSFKIDSLQALDVNLGTLSINDEIPDVDVPEYLEVTDRTGANGWLINVSATNFDETKDTIRNTITLTNAQDVESDAVVISDAAQLAVSGPSLRDPQKIKGVVASEWGVSPENKGFNSELLWTLTPNVAEASTGN